MAKRKIKELLELFVGIDLHKTRLHVTIMTRDVDLFSGSINGEWENMSQILDRYKGRRIHAVYEASYSGFWLFDRLEEYGVEAMVTPPSLVPREYGNRVKTDRRDRRKLAHLLAKDLLKAVWVPNPPSSLRNPPRASRTGSVGAPRNACRNRPSSRGRAVAPRNSREAPKAFLPRSLMSFLPHCATYPLRGE